MFNENVEHDLHATTTYFLQWKIESGKWKIVLNNFQLSIIHFQFREGVGWEKRERFPPL